MKLPYDKELAREAIEGGFGKLVTKNGIIAQVLNWDYKGNPPCYTMSAKVDGLEFCYTNAGRLFNYKEDDYDLHLEVPDDILN